MTTVSVRDWIMLESPQNNFYSIDSWYYIHYKIHNPKYEGEGSKFLKIFPDYLNGK